MITLTREEAQQVLDALVFATPSEFGPTEAYKDAIVLLQNLLAQPELEQDDGVCGNCNGNGCKFCDARYLIAEPVILRRGDILRCIETNELCTVWATSTTGKTQVKWKANDFGSYTAEQIGDLFWVEPKPEPEPVAWLEPEWGERICPEVGYEVTITADHPKDLCWIPLYTVPPQREWQGLTDEEIDALHKKDRAWPLYSNIARDIEAKLKEKNT